MNPGLSDFTVHHHCPSAPCGHVYIKCNSLCPNAFSFLSWCFCSRFLSALLFWWPGIEISKTSPFSLLCGDKPEVATSLICSFLNSVLGSVAEIAFLGEDTAYLVLREGERRVSSGFPGFIMPLLLANRFQLTSSLWISYKEQLSS